MHFTVCNLSLDLVSECYLALSYSLTQIVEEPETVNVLQETSLETHCWIGASEAMILYHFCFLIMHVDVYQHVDTYQRVECGEAATL